MHATFLWALFSLFIVGMTVMVALVARKFGLRIGVSHEMRASQANEQQVVATAPAAQTNLR